MDDLRDLGASCSIFLVVCLLGWRDEQHGRIKAEEEVQKAYDGRPILVLKVYLVAGSIPREWVSL